MSDMWVSVASGCHVIFWCQEHSIVLFIGNKGILHNVDAQRQYVFVWYFLQTWVENTMLALNIRVCSFSGAVLNTSLSQTHLCVKHFGVRHLSVFHLCSGPRVNISPALHSPAPAPCPARNPCPLPRRERGQRGQRGSRGHGHSWEMRISFWEYQTECIKPSVLNWVY